MNADDASDPFQPGQVLDAGFVVLQTGDEVDVHEQWQVLERRPSKFVENAGQLSESAALQKHDARARDQIAMLVGIPNDWDDVSSETMVD